MLPSDRFGDPRVRSLSEVIRESFITGLAVVVPILVTVLVFAFVLRSLYGYLDLLSDVVGTFPIITIVPGVLGIRVETIIEILIPLLLLYSILMVGLAVNSSRYGERAVDYFDYLVAQVPGVGSVYESFRQMSDVMLDDDNQNFQEVKLVEFPSEETYTLGFVTTETPTPLADGTRHDEMVTMFLPLAPNPVMGGHLVHVPTSRVRDVNLTVEQGLRAVVTSGVGIADAGKGDESDLSADELAGLAHDEWAEQRLDPDPEVERRRTDPTEEGRREAYDEQVDPEHADRPSAIARRERVDANVPTGDVPPARVADRDAADRAQTEVEPAALAGGDGPSLSASDVRGRGEQPDPASRHGDPRAADPAVVAEVRETLREVEGQVETTLADLSELGDELESRVETVSQTVSTPPTDDEPPTENNGSGGGA